MKISEVAGPGLPHTAEKLEERPHTAEELEELEVLEEQPHTAESQA